MTVDDAPESEARHVPLVRFLKLRFERRDENGVWLCLALLLGAVASAAFLHKAALVPSGIQSDAQMFLSWTGRFDDPDLLKGDLVADYWRSVTPWFYRGLFRAASAAGLEPVPFARLLPAILFPLCALFAFRFLRSIGAEPLVACIAAAAVIVIVAHDGSVASATPRAFRPAMFLMLLDGLSRDKILQGGAAQLLLAASYPQLALVSATAIGLILLAPRPPFVRLAARPLLLVAVCAAATVAGILPFLLQSEGFGPIVTLEGARHIPTFGPAGRNRIFEPDGSLDLVCGYRPGVFAGACDGIADPKLYLLLAAVLIGPVVLAVRQWRNAPAGSIRSHLPSRFLIASFVWFAIAAALLFRLHLPSRYTSDLLLIGALTTIPLLIERIRRRPFPPWLVEKRAGRAVLLGGSAAALAGLIAAAASVPSVMKAPSDPHLIEVMKALPKDAMTAGFAEDLNFSPVLARRAVLFNRELTIGYQLGFLHPILRRMEDMRDVLLTREPSVLVDRLARNGVDMLVVQPEALAVPKIPRSFRGFFDETALEAEEARALAGGPTALARLASGCLRQRLSAVDLIDARCLIERSRRSDERSGAVEPRQ